MSSATADAWSEGENLFTRLRLRFRSWRRTRPFWAGLLAMIAGVPIMYLPYAHLSLGGMTVAMSTTAGAGSLIIGILLMVLGLTAWYQPAVRVFAGVATTLLTLVSIPVSNLAGFGLALIPGLVGGGLMVSWAPLKERAATDLPAAGDGTADEAAGTEGAAHAADGSATEVVLAVAEQADAEPVQGPRHAAPAARTDIPAQAGEPEEAR
ncbi:hypothetical protein J2S46_005226 [Kitasatospora herbaricolor]|uniref:DUF6114 domain-containing protein n=1 Tax=Kitasatospora herbaricolor TaxID=68217 RepID=UPI00174D5751|nr:DUF6114 domain-containing protein [Kitasatospora herbaricolor]MDQ0310670.1 hypothetical protein [Kitasatospora herbaricolor]